LLELSLLVYGTQETILVIAKKKYFELMGCFVKNLLVRVEESEIKINS
jgi:hypothetical protein